MVTLRAVPDGIDPSRLGRARARPRTARPPRRRRSYPDRSRSKCRTAPAMRFDRIGKRRTAVRANDRPFARAGLATASDRTDESAPRHPPSPVPLISIGCARIHSASTASPRISDAHGRRGAPADVRMIALGNAVRRARASQARRAAPRRSAAGTPTRAACRAIASSARPRSARPAASIDGTLGHRHDRPDTGQEMKTVVREPDAGAERHQRVGVADGDVLDRASTIG